MPARIRLRALTPVERHELERLSHSRTAPARSVERARIILAAAEVRRIGDIASELDVSRPTVSAWVRRFNDGGLAALDDLPRSGRPHTYAEQQRAEVLAAALTDPKALGLPFGCWTLDRLQAYLNEQKAIPIKRSRIDELLRAEGLVWRHQETWFGERVDPAFAAKRAAIDKLYTDPPADSTVVCLDEMGPQAAKSYPGNEPIRTAPEDGPGEARRPAGRAKQEIDYGRRGKGYIFGAFRPATGEALTAPYPSRSAANRADFMADVDEWIPAEVSRVYAIVDNLQAHRATDVLLFCLAHPRWEFVFQPKYAAYLNLIEPWWKVLKSLALKGRRFATWEEVCQAVEEATAYWNGHRHPFVWGRRRRHRPRRRPGIAAGPGVRRLAG
jgi:transposase